MNKHKIFLIVGRTAAGKDTLTNKVAQELNLKVLTSYTTRPRRVNEGDTHIFVDEAGFIKYKNQNQIVAFTQINGYKYFCTIDQLKECDFYIIDPAGVKYMKLFDLPDIEFKTIYITAPYLLRKFRAIEKRRDAEENFESRNADEDAQFTEFENNSEYDYQIDALEEDAYDQLLNIVKGELSDECEN